MIRQLPEFIFKDFWLKLFSLALATLLWFTIFQAIQQQGTPVTSFNTNLRKRTFYNLPVKAVSSSSDVHKFKLSPGEVQVTVQGDGKLVDSLQADDIKAQVDLSGMETEGDLHLRVQVATPTGLTCIELDPPEVQVVPPSKTNAPSQ